MELTDNQQQVIRQIEDFLQSDDNVFILLGYAGTGKTTIIKELVKKFNSEGRGVQVMAPTGRAANVLRQKFQKDDINAHASTIHRGIYEFARIVVQKKESDDEHPQFIYPIRQRDNICPIIVDEASMVTSKKSENEMFSFGTGYLLDDLLTYSQWKSGGKIIFVGDDAQLPPVGENCSPALDRSYFEDLGIKVQVVHLTEVVRQDSDSAILKTATEMRNLLAEPVRNEFALTEQDGEVERIDIASIPQKYLDLNPELATDKSAVICFSNENALRYNKAIRNILHGKDQPLKEGDLLMVVHNNIKYDFYNGDIMKVVSVGQTEQKEFTRRKNKESIYLEFQDIELQTPDGIVKCKIISSMLNSTARDLSYEEMTALYISFKTRNQQLDPNSPLFAEALAADPYYSAVHVKYGYAITCHKSQGGEWESVIVDYFGRTGLSNDCLRWSYTATTRAQSTLYACNISDITPFSFKKNSDDSVKNVGKPKMEESFMKQAETPFHTPDSKDYLKAKYHAIVDKLIDTKYSVTKVQSLDYCERYTIAIGKTGNVAFDLLRQLANAK